jgi:hypothetical protein
MEDEKVARVKCGVKSATKLNKALISDMKIKKIITYSRAPWSHHPVRVIEAEGFTCGLRDIK